MTKTEYLLRELRSSLWIKPTITGLAAVAWVSIAYATAEYLPDKMKVGIERQILINLFGIMASTMLTVATFSVAAMVSAFAAVSTTATPRATRILMQDRTTQNSLASFLSAFIYAIVALVALSITTYGAGGRLILFVGYCIMVVWLLISFIRWVDRVSNLGRMSDTLNRVEEACRETFQSSEIIGTLGANPVSEKSFSGTVFKVGTIGYVQNIDIAALDRIAEEIGSTIRVLERPGAFVDHHNPLALIADAKELDEDVSQRISEAFEIGASRRIDSDPRFCLILLSEIADRALSPAINDPGTAIAILGIELRMLKTCSDHLSKNNEVKYANVEVEPLDPEDLLDDAFTAISRDGARISEVGSRIQKNLSVIARMGNEKLTMAAVRHSKLALEQAEQSLTTESHKDTIRKLAEKVG